MTNQKTTKTLPPQLTQNNDEHSLNCQPACFVAGTLVHTDKGLGPIQELKVGDMVLSKPESGEGKAEYKPVLSTFKSQHKEKIYKVEYYNETADERGEKGINYILCNALHPFWVSKTPTTDIDAKLEGEWLAAEDLPPGNLTSAHGDALWLDDYSYLPVRTLPNFPEGCAYMQSIDHHDGWLTNYADNVEFVLFNNNAYQYLVYNNGDYEDFKRFQYEFTSKVCNLIDKLNEKEPFVLNQELFKALAMRLNQDMKSEYFSSQKYSEEMLSPVIIDGRVARENRIVGEKGMQAFKRRLSYIDNYGDSTGLTEGQSIHHSMEKYYDECPNPYEDHVYNIEVADHHTYFVGHDGIWVHNTKCKAERVS